MPTILMVVCISGVVHLLAHYLDNLRRGDSKESALKQTFKETGKAILLTSFTTMVGFLSLSTSSITPIIELGIFTAMGVGFSFILALLLFRSMLEVLKVPKVETSQKKRNFWVVFLEKNFKFVVKNKWGIFIFAVVVIGITLVGIGKIKVNNYILEDLKKDNPLKISYQFLGEEFSGARPFEMAIIRKDTSVSFYDQTFLTQLDTLSSYLDTVYGTGTPLSILTLVKGANSANNAGLPSEFRIPTKEKKFKKIIREIKRYKGNEDIKNVISSDGNTTRITATMGDVGSAKTAVLDPKLFHFIQEHFNTNQYEFRLTGGPFLMEENNKLLAKNVLQGLFVAVLIVGLIIAFLYRSIAIVFISIIPNLIPLLVIGAIMGFGGIDMKVSTSLVFTIAFGIAVDDTIHFLESF